MTSGMKGKAKEARAPSDKRGRPDEFRSPDRRLRFLVIFETIEEKSCGEEKS